jgi:DNA polymerase III alpha subunit (gram-positive type)
MKENLLRFNNKQKYMVFDFETCNLNLTSTDNKPWQLAFSVYDGPKLVESKDYYIHWDDLKMSDGARKVTGFTHSTYKKRAEPAEKILDHFEEYLYNDDYIKLGHNILGFDIYIHNIYRKLLGRKADYSYLNRSLDTLCLAKAIAKDIQLNDGDDLLSWQFKLNSIYQRGLRLSLGACCKTYEVDLDPSKLHNALYDIQKNYEVFKKLLWKIEI